LIHDTDTSLKVQKSGRSIETMKAKILIALAVILVISVVVPSSLALSNNSPVGFQATNGVNAAPFPVNPSRYDPYKNYKFAVKWDGKTIWGIHEVTGLTRTTETIDDRQGNESSIPHIMPGLTRYEPIVLKRGVTQDRAFEEWSNMVFRYGYLPENMPSSFRKDIYIELYNEAGQKVMAWMVYRAWPSEYTALEVLDANKGDIAVESMTLQHEGWERDLAVTEPTEP
jgi:phage tail-like protein